MLLLLCGCSSAHSSNGILKLNSETVGGAVSIEYSKSAELTLYTIRGQYNLNYSINTASVKNVESVSEISAKQMDKQVDLMVFSDSEFSYVPLYADVYVKKAAKRDNYLNLVPLACNHSVSAKNGFFEDKKVITSIHSCQNLKSYIAAQLQGCVNIAEFVSLTWEDAVFSDISLTVNLEKNELPFYLITGSFAFPEKEVSADFSFTLEIISINSLDGVSFPLEEEEIKKLGSYRDFIENEIYPMANLITKSQWGVLFGFVPDDDFDFLSFDFEDYPYVLYWENFLNVVK